MIDAGCGPGGSFPYLVNAVGPTGEVVGVDISPEGAIHARRRTEKNRWRNVQVATANAEAVKLTGKFDGLLMFPAPDVYASPQALANLLPYLKNDARIVAFGAKLSRRRAGKMFNSFFRARFSKLSFSSTPGLTYEPWDVLERRVGEIKVEERFLGWMFLAWGSMHGGGNIS